MPEPRRPLEEKAAPFGARGQWAVDGTTDMFLSQRWYESGAKFFAAEVSPSISYFVTRNFAIGASVFFAYQDSQGFQADGAVTDYQQTKLSAGPTLAYNVPLGRRASWLVRGSASFGSVWASSSTVLPGASLIPAQSASQLDASASVYAPLLFHAVQHFFFGLGPYLSHDFAKTNAGLELGGQSTTVGLGFLVGGYAGGDVPARGDDPNPPRRFIRHLGDDKTVAFTNDLNVGGSFSHSPSSDSSGGSIGVLFGADAFVGAHVSVGGAGMFNYARSAGTNTVTALHSTRETGSLALEGRLGYGLRLNDELLFWPRAHVRLGILEETDKTSTVKNSYEIDTINVGLYAPIDLELAPHFFVGLGPDISRDLVAAVGPATTNYSTYLGASVEVGGWL